MKKIAFRRWRRPPCSMCGGRFRDHARITDHKYQSDPSKYENASSLSQAHEFVVKAQQAKKNPANPPNRKLY